MPLPSCYGPVCEQAFEGRRCPADPWPCEQTPQGPTAKHPLVRAPLDEIDISPGAGHL